LNEFAITCSRDKNSRGFLVNGVETDDEYLEVVAVSPFDCVPVNTVRADGTRVKARMAPDCCLPLGMADIKLVDIEFYLNAAAGIGEVKETEE
jgi:hypothetical protein